MTTLISFIIVLGVLIFIHELGHFAVAKLCGVGVEKFSLGFGPKLVGARLGETEYRISALPLGGYVKMVGEAPGEEVTDTDRSKSFTAKPVWKKILIVGAGPVMNLALAAVLLPFIFLIGIQVPAYLDKPPVIGYVAPGEAAAKAGIQKGDLVKSINGKEVKDWEALLGEVALSPGKQLDVAIARDGSNVTAKLVPDTSRENGAGIGGIFPPMDPVIGDIAPGFPAKEAGLKPGDRIISINDVRITHWAELEALIHKDGGKKDFVVQRGSETLKFELKPKYNEDAKVFLVGISRKVDQTVRKYGLVESISKGVAASIDMTGKLFVVMKGLVTGQYSLKTLGGPIMIAQVAGKAAETGVAELLSLVAFLSLQLGIINLFPIPVLDGGHLVFFGIEAVKGSPVSEKFMAIAQQIGFALLIALMLLVTYNDIFRMLG